MSKQSQTADRKKTTQRAEVGRAMKGCEILVEALEREGVEAIFAYPGGASMELHQALTKSKIRTILPRHEQQPNPVRIPGRRRGIPRHRPRPSEAGDPIDPRYPQRVHADDESDQCQRHQPPSDSRASFPIRGTHRSP